MRDNTYRNPLSHSYLDNKVLSYVWLEAKHKDKNKSYLDKFKKKTENREPQLRRLVYRNAAYHGRMSYQFTNKMMMKNGQGVLLFPNGSIVFSNWSNNQLHGDLLMFPANGGTIFCQLFNGKINNWLIYQHPNQQLVCQLYHLDQQQPNRYQFYIDNNRWIHRSRNKTQQQTRPYGQMPDIIKQEALTKRLSEFWSKNYGGINKLKIKSEELQYYGFEDGSSRPSGLGIIKSKKQAYIGHFHQGSLDCCGRIQFSTGDIYQGGFQTGKVITGRYYSAEEDKTFGATYDYKNRNQQIKEWQGNVLGELQLYDLNQVGYEIIEEDIEMPYVLSKIESIIDLWKDVEGEREPNIIITFNGKGQNSGYFEDPVIQYSQKNQKARKISDDSLQIGKPYWLSKKDNGQSMSFMDYESRHVDMQQSEGIQQPSEIHDVSVSLAPENHEAQSGQLILKRRLERDKDELLKILPQIPSQSEANTEKLKNIVQMIPKKKRIFGELKIDKLNFD